MDGDGEEEEGGVIYSQLAVGLERIASMSILISSTHTRTPTVGGSVCVRGCVVRRRSGVDAVRSGAPGGGG